ncbi:MAG: PQQ-like domain [Actinomycetia bacterium]|nr:PQQ-like domain [Actinomycetes bacterium]
MERWRRLVVGSGVLALLAAPVAARADTPACAWATYGHDAAHTFTQDPACAAVDGANVATLVPKWVVHTTDSVTASPAVVDGKLYVGAWDGTFYAVDVASGAVDWTYRVADDHAVAFGRIVSSAAVTEVGRGQRAILFGGGATLHALDPSGRLLAAIDLDPRTPADKARQAADPPTVEIESSPVVADIGGKRVIYVGLDVHNQRGVGRTGVVALTLDRRADGWAFTPRWKFDVEAGRAYPGTTGLTEGSGTGLGCGGVWSSPAVDVGHRLVTFGSASCSYPAEAEAAGLNASEAMFGVDADTGALRWKFQPATTTADRLLDDDFGASPNLYRLGDRLVVGEGRKDAGYHVRDARTGAAVFSAVVGTPGNAQEDFAIGGFLGTTAVWSDAGRPRAIIGATAIPVPHDPGELERATWAVRAIDPADGHVLWVHRLAGPAYGPTTVANGVAFVPDTFTSSVQALDAATGELLWTAPVGGPPASAPVVVGGSVYLGAGTRETDAEFKSVGTQLQAVGDHPLSPISGIYAFHLLSEGRP